MEKHKDVYDIYTIRYVTHEKLEHVHDKKKNIFSD